MAELRVCDSAIFLIFAKVFRNCAESIQKFKIKYSEKFGVFKKIIGNLCIN
jgi:hypothetical protein